MKNSRYDLTQGSVLTNLLRMAVPSFCSQLLQDLFNVVDMIFVGRLGAPALAAVAMSANLLRLIGILGHGISTGTVILVAQSLGANKPEDGQRIAMQALILSLICGLGVGCLGYPLAEFGLRLLGAEKDVIPLGIGYLQVTLLGLVLMFLSRTLNAIFRAVGDAITPMMVLICSTILNIVLDPLLIFGIWFFPSLGVVGSAYATLISRGVGVVMLLSFCLSGQGVISLSWVKPGVNFKIMGQIMKLGIFTSMQALLRHGSRLTFIRVVAFFGTDAVAAYAISMRLRILVMHFGTAFSTAVGPMVGQNLGANRLDRVEQSVRLGSRLAALVVMLVGAVMFIIPHYFVGWFTHQRSVIEIGSVYLRYLAATFGFMVVSSVLGRALNGTGDTISPMIMTGISQLSIGLVLVLVLFRLMGMVGIWIGIALSNIVQCLMMRFWYQRGEWKSKKQVYEL